MPGPLWCVKGQRAMAHACTHVCTQHMSGIAGYQRQGRHHWVVFVPSKSCPQRLKLPISQLTHKFQAQEPPTAWKFPAS